jgi:acetylornithine deacetylase
VSAAKILQHLEALVACDTQNPPRGIDGDSEIFAHCSRVLPPGFASRIWDHGDGHVSWFAVRGRPKVLFNVHLDTVPAGDGWSGDPLRLRVEHARAYGRGACDIKGAAAVLLALASKGPRHLALLFTTDEEGEGGCCVDRFLASGEGARFGQVIVAEPTSCRAVLGHRGFLSVKTRFHGSPGHASAARGLRDHANHPMARWAARALEGRLGETSPGTREPAQSPGWCKAAPGNVIAAGLAHWARLA